MSKKTIALVAGAVAAVLIGALVVISVLQGNPDDVKEETPVLSDSTEITEADQQMISSLTSQFLRDVGTYGWFSGMLSDVENAKQGVEFFLDKNHRGANEVRSSIIVLTENQEYAKKVDPNLFNTPFSVETVATDDIVVPKFPVAEGGTTYIPVSIPVKSTLIWVTNETAYVGDDGETAGGGVSLNRFIYEGQLELKFVRKGSGWIISSYASTVGILPTDSWGLANGSTYGDPDPVSTELIPVVPGR